ncbi:hypothetical protein SSX86_018135 [Deinandra increscens subsp. villosa]|uniref:Replication protein A OB domain-containing protein n=1 Tax=Deinandra increscens subsp. villosa TaxID=3103831 RepID=A0AAP0CQ63_9ASTR
MDALHIVESFSYVVKEEVRYSMVAVRVEFSFLLADGGGLLLIFFDYNRQRMAAIVPQPFVRRFASVASAGGVFALLDFSVATFYKDEFPTYYGYILACSDKRIVIDDRSQLRPLLDKVSPSFPLFAWVPTIERIKHDRRRLKLIIDVVGQIVDGDRLPYGPSFRVRLRDATGHDIEMTVYYSSMLIPPDFTFTMDSSNSSDATGSEPRLPSVTSSLTPSSSVYNQTPLSHSLLSHPAPHRQNSSIDVSSFRRRPGKEVMGSCDLNNAIRDQAHMVAGTSSSIPSTSNVDVTRQPTRRPDGRPALRGRHSSFPNSVSVSSSSQRNGTSSSIPTTSNVDVTHQIPRRPVGRPPLRGRPSSFPNGVSVGPLGERNGNMPTYWDCGNADRECTHCKALCWDCEDGGGPFTFCLNGINHHKIGTLLPTHDDGQPRFAQLYVYDTSNEADNRISALRHCIPRNTNEAVLRSLVDDLIMMLNANNALVQAFRMARERFNDSDRHPVKIRLIGSRNSHGSQYNLPTAYEVAALIPGDCEAMDSRDILIQERDTYTVKRVSELHPSFMALQYPLLFPYGEDGFRLQIPLRNANSPNGRKYVTLREYYCFRLHVRRCEGKTLHRGGRLFHTYVVDAYAAVLNNSLECTFPDLESNISDHRYLQERCVLCPTNDEVDEVKLCVLEKLTGELYELLSADEIFMSYNKISDSHPNVTDKWQINIMGSSIHGKIPTNVMHPFKDVFVEGSVYRIHKFVVLHYKSKYRPLRCDIFVQFIRSTMIHASMLQSSSFTRHVFEFVPFNSLAQHENDDTYLTDVIGVLCQWGVVEKIDSVKSTNNEVHNIVILDEMGLDVSVSLWGNLARQISDDDIRNHGSPNIVIVLCSCRVRRFKGSLCLWTTASSQLYIDLPVSVLHIYKNIHVDHVVFNLANQGRTYLKGRANQTDVGMHITSMSQLLTDLQEGVPKGTMYNIYVNVIGVDSTNDWNYKLVLNIIESGVQASFVLFDDSAIPFVGFTVDELIEKSNLEGDDNPEWVVDFLKELLLAREAKFRIKVDDYNMAPNYVRRFTVSKLIGDHDDFPNNRTILALSDSDAVRSNDDVHVEPVIDGECAIDEDEKEKEFHSKISEEEMELADEALLDPRALSIRSNSSLTMVDASNEVDVVSPVSVSIVNEVDTRDEDTSDVVVPDVESGGSVGRSRPRRKNVKTPIRYRT